MRFSRKVNYCILAALVLVTILIRYPISVEHEMGSDTTFIHTMADSIAQDGQAKWILHPTSYFGLYALSYPSAAPFILASGFDVTGISIEGMVFFLGILLAVSAVLSCYLVAKQIRNDDIFAHAIALLFTLAPFYIKDTTWVASSRGFVVAIIPFFMLLLLRHTRTRDVRYLLLSLAVFVVLASTHRMGILSILIIITYLFAIPLDIVTQRLRFSLARFEKPFRYAMVIVVLAAFLSFFYIQFLFPGISGADVVQQYQNGALFAGTSFPTLLLNMTISLAGRIGLLLPLVPVGLVAYAWKRPKESGDKFFLLVTFAFIPLLSLRDYIAEFLIPVFVVLIVIGAMSLVSVFKNRKQLKAVLLVGLVVSSVAFSWVMKDHWRSIYPTDGPIPFAIYDSALYVRHRTWGTVLTNAGLTGGRIAAISNRPNMPLGGASTHFFSPQQLMWGFVDGKSMAVRLVDLTKVSLDTDSIYVPVGVRNVEVDWEVILAYKEPVIAVSSMDYYDVHFVAADNGLMSYYASYGYTRISCLLGDDGMQIGDPYKICTETRNVLPDNYYVFFDNEMTTLWLARGGLAGR